MAIAFVVSGMLLILAVHYYIQFLKTPQPPAPTTTTTTTTTTKRTPPWKSGKGGGLYTIPEEEFGPTLHLTKPTHDEGNGNSSESIVSKSTKRKKKSKEKVGGLRFKAADSRNIPESSGFSNDITEELRTVQTPSINYITQYRTESIESSWPRRRYPQPLQRDRTKWRTPMFEDDNISRQRRFDSGHDKDDIVYQQTPSPYNRHITTRRKFPEETLSWMYWVPTALKTYEWEREI